ncbi:MAG: hypothetical protein JXR91_10245 [Deltaproteobacteria bacterium]|nr:hypothetical protein [Deltaproteobacteria bacterium]
MKFKCPQCSTLYNLPGDSLPRPTGNRSAHKMRCVRCKCTFLLSVELVRLNDEIASKPEDSTYIELLSPRNLPNLEFKGTGDYSEETKPTHVMYQVQEASLKQQSEPTSQPVSNAQDAWTSGAPLDLSDFELNKFAKAQKRKSIFAAVLFFSVLGFFVFVAAANDWTISVNKFDEQVKRTFGLLTQEEKSRDLFTMVPVLLEKGYPLRLRKGLKKERLVGIITGSLQNNSPYELQHVILEGVLLDKARNVVATTAVPCGIIVSDKKIGATRNRNIIKLYNDGEEVFNCKVKSGFNETFKVIFTEIPKDFDSSYTFQAHLKQALPVKVTNEAN